jgi:ADP-ribose pyrophosphatase YjhB (NUDIX family)
MKVQKLTFDEFKSIYSRVPRSCVEIIVQTNSGVLLTKRDIEPLRGQWHIPGGTVLMGETIKQAIERISKEELGLTVEIKKMLGIIEYDIKNYFSQPIGLAFLVTTPNSTNIKLDKQASDVNFFEIIPRNTVREHKLFLHKFLSKK